jgi:hypothetical protein
VSDLVALQRELAAYLLGRSPIAPEITHAGSIAPRVGWSVHRNNVRSSLRRALESTFPATRRYVREVPFRELADRFVRVAPPTRGWLSAYGAAFPGFLAGAGDACAADIARIDWSEHLAALAREEAPLDLCALLRLSDESLARLRLRRATQLLAVRAAAFNAWAMGRGAEVHAPRGEEVDLLVLRAREGVTVEEVPPPYTATVERLARGDDLLAMLPSPSAAAGLAESLCWLARVGAIVA